MNLVSAFKLIPEKKVAANPVAAGSMDLLTVLAVATPLTIRQASETRVEQLKREEALEFTKRAVESITRNSQLATKRKRKAIEDEENQTALASTITTGPLLMSTLSALGSIVSAGFTAIATAAGFAFSMLSSAVGGVLRFAFMNPAVLLGAGVIGLGFLGYKMIFDPEEETSVMGIERGPIMVRSSAGESRYQSYEQYQSPGTKQSKSKVSSNVALALRTASTQVGVPLDMLTKLAGTESAFREDVKAPKGSATGLFQFLSATWARVLEKYGPRYGLSPDADRTDPLASSLMAAAMIKHEGIPAASSVVGTPTVTDVYITHFKGAKGGRRFLRDVKRRPNDIAATYMGETVLANNRSVFYKNGDLTRPRTFQEVYDYFTSRLDKFEHHVSLVESYPVLATAPPEVPDEILLNPVSVADASSGTKPLTTASFIPSNIGLLRINNG